MFRLRAEAEADLDSIALYISNDNPRAALRWFESMLDRCRKVGEMPGMGVSRPKVRPDLRKLAVGDYLILYREIEGGAEIVRILHGARNWQELL